MSAAAWARTDSVIPPEGVVLDAITESGTPTQLVWSSGMWWLPDRSMYVYSTPVWWREAAR